MIVRVASASPGRMRSSAMRELLARPARLISACTGGDERRPQHAVEAVAVVAVEVAQPPSTPPTSASCRRCGICYSKRAHGLAGFQGAKALDSPRSAGLEARASGAGSRSTCRCRRSTACPAACRRAGVKSCVKKRSLLSRRDAITMKIRNAVSLNAKPCGSGSANIPTVRSTRSMSSAVDAAHLLRPLRVVGQRLEARWRAAGAAAGGTRCSGARRARASAGCRSPRGPAARRWAARSAAGRAGSCAGGRRRDARGRRSRGCRRDAIRSLRAPRSAGRSARGTASCSSSRSSAAERKRPVVGISGCMR